MTGKEYRAEFDATVTFGNGGNLRVEGFRVDVPGAQVGEDEVGALFVASLGLLMADRIEVSGLRVFPEPHKGTRGGPSDTGRDAAAPLWRWVELSHVITPGMITYPGLPGPEYSAHLTREASRDLYAPGTEFAIDRVSMLGNTGTYLDSPFHRYADGIDLAHLPLTSFADLPAVVVRTTGSGTRGVDVGALAALDVTDRAVLLHTGGDADWGTAAYADNAPYLTEAGAAWLVEHRARLVGIDSVNIDEITARGHRPVHTRLLAAAIPIVEHLTGLDQLPPSGARFTEATALRRVRHLPRTCLCHGASRACERFVIVGVELTGWLGALAVLLAFALLTNRRVTAFGRTYVVLNVAGSTGLAVNGVAHSAWPSVVLNLLWLAIAVLAGRDARRQDAADREAPIG